MEEAAWKLPEDDTQDLRMRVCGIISSSKLPKDNITRSQQVALKEMKGWDDQVILAADKGNATVVMERSDYDGKVRELLSDTTTYRCLPKDPTQAQETKISCKLREFQKNEITTPIYNRLRLTGSQPPRLYGLPKIHKQSVPLRPIVSCIGSPSYQLSKYIASIISPLAGRTSSHVLNSKHFAETMGDITIGSDESLVSFDVTSLFTNVPIGEAVEIIRDRLREDEDLVERTPLSPDRIAELLGLCLKSTYFSYSGEFYEQREGAAMGSPVSAIVANLYVEFFEELALESAPSRPRLWKRYVDDTCCILKTGDVDGLLNHLNSLRPTIKIHHGAGGGGGPLPFLDTRVTSLTNEKLDITVYRKKTHREVPAL